MRLLCISNGHGEDVIALRVLSALEKTRSDISISALPISGMGRAYQAKNISLIAPVQSMPSGGFVNRDPKQLTRDMKGGLLQLTRRQLSAVRAWVRSATGSDCILAVGDIVPLLFSYISKRPYHFIGTAKSEYWLRDERGKLPAQSWVGRLEGWSGSVYLPWERWLMSRAQSVFVRDALSAKQLRQLGVHANYAGNPMMDGLAPTEKLNLLIGELHQQLRREVSVSVGQNADKATALYVTPKQKPAEPLTVALIPGSRPPEAYENWTRILKAMPSLADSFSPRALVMLAAIAPNLQIERFKAAFSAAWKSSHIASYPIFTYRNITIALTNDAYNDCLHESEAAIATAGTATEQFVGLGKPVITLPGNGPQFTPYFATVQAKMLGPSIQTVEDPNKVGEALSKLISDPDRLQLIYQNGIHRMGTSGAAERIAQKISERMNAVQ